MDNANFHNQSTPHEQHAGQRGDVSGDVAHSKSVVDETTDNDADTHLGDERSTLTAPAHTSQDEDTRQESRSGPRQGSADNKHQR